MKDRELHLAQLKAQQKIRRLIAFWLSKRQENGDAGKDIYSPVGGQLGQNSGENLRLSFSQSSMFLVVNLMCRRKHLVSEPLAAQSHRPLQHLLMPIKLHRC
jgi:hypothetical protein